MATEKTSERQASPDHELGEEELATVAGGIALNALPPDPCVPPDPYVTTKVQVHEINVTKKLDKSSP